MPLSHSYLSSVGSPHSRILPQSFGLKSVFQGTSTRSLSGFLWKALQGSLGMHKAYRAWVWLGRGRKGFDAIHKPLRHQPSILHGVSFLIRPSTASAPARCQAGGRCPKLKMGLCNHRRNYSLRLHQLCQGTGSHSTSITSPAMALTRVRHSSSITVNLRLPFSSNSTS